MRARLVSALSQLPDIYRAAVLLRDVQGLSTVEASVVLGVKTQTLKSRLASRTPRQENRRVVSFSGLA
jgi:DNA-directed RNA polymerase specialized sigma24 family protein